MASRWRRVPLRARVALAFAATSALALLALGVFVHLRVAATLEAQTRDALATQLDALERVPAADRAEAVETMTGATFGQVLGPDGALLAGSPQVRAAPLLADPGRGGPDGADTWSERVVLLTGDDEPEVVLLLARRSAGQVLVTGTSGEAAEDALDGIRTQFLVGAPLTLLLASGLGYAVAGAALRPMERMRRQAEAISARSSGDRLSLPAASDEVHRLGTTLNAMLDRLDQGLLRERRFVAEASHELRTPLALLRTELDLALARPRGSDELVAALRSASEEVDRLTRLSEDLLVLAAADDREAPLALTEVRVDDLLAAVAARFGSAAPDGRRVLVASGTGSLGATVRADRARLDRALANLVDNALRHGSGDVELSTVGEGRTVAIRVADHGSDWAPQAPGGPGQEGTGWDRPGLGGPGRGGPRSGFGLGLPIVRAIAERHGGTLAVEAGQTGTVVSLRLPQAQDFLQTTVSDGV
ncbi:ATP-binding protein [Nocardioides donggukensis]|uniref:histidine kinase n=1 Tax=Nocardioides donggukensis TaxID=2774019 RepID=A0A927K5R1_9ACTN|nr:ATP-binding protein [Nocardioides donggukensis]MBD8870318.1 HAMP domain-containing protein [Nocardioides donggukensis]